MTEKKARFEDLLEFPSLFVFRVLAHQHEGIRQRCSEAVFAFLSRREEGMEERPSGQGNYVALRIGVMVVSADEIRGLYAVLHAVDGVRMVL